MGTAISGMPASVSHSYYHSALEYIQIYLFGKFFGENSNLQKMSCASEAIPSCTFGFFAYSIVFLPTARW